MLNENEIHSRSYISFKINNKEEAENLISYMKCKLTHILLSLRKQTHNLCNANYFKWIPIIPLNQKWDNSKLYEYFQLDNQDIQFIESIQIDGTFT